MSAAREHQPSKFCLACFYAAFYLCACAPILVGYQYLMWLRHGVWESYPTSILLDWLSWKRAPTVPFWQLQTSVDSVWDRLANQPISMSLAGLSFLAGAIGSLCKRLGEHTAEIYESY